MKKLLMMATAAGFLFVAQPAKAEVETYEFDKPHTSILFFADHLGFSKSQGEFHDPGRRPCCSHSEDSPGRSAGFHRGAG